MHDCQFAERPPGYTAGGPGVPPPANTTRTLRAVPFLIQLGLLTRPGEATYKDTRGIGSQGEYTFPLDHEASLADFVEDSTGDGKRYRSHTGTKIATEWLTVADDGIGPSLRVAVG
jgi:hypothetical protein